MNECVFCTRQEQPEALFETAGLYVMPDKFPMTPGHVLVIGKAQSDVDSPGEACYSVTTIDLERP